MQHKNIKEQPWSAIKSEGLCFHKSDTSIRLLKIFYIFLYCIFPSKKKCLFKQTIKLQTNDFACSSGSFWGKTFNSSQFKKCVSIYHFCHANDFQWCFTIEWMKGSKIQTETSWKNNTQQWKFCCLCEVETIQQNVDEKFFLHSA